MDPLDKHLKSILPTANDDGTIDVKLHNGEVIALMNCLNFAYSAARMLNEIELKKGTTIGAKKMTRIQSDAKQLAQMLEDHLYIGQPENGNVN